MTFKGNLKKLAQPTVISLFLAIVVGFLLTTQFYSTNKVAEVTDPEAQINQALEVSILAESNTDLREEVTILQEQQREYDEVLQFRLGGTEVLESTLARYKEASGLEELAGEGVKVTINGPVLDVHLLDLLNNLRNIGIQGVTINNQRLIYKSFIVGDGLEIKLDGIALTSPYRFEAVGNADLLESSLLREGGLLEQLGQTFSEVKISVNKKDNLILPAYRDAITFEYAKVVNDD